MPGPLKQCTQKSERACLMIQVELEFSRQDSMRIPKPTLKLLIPITILTLGLSYAVPVLFRGVLFTILILSLEYTRRLISRQLTHLKTPLRAHWAKNRIPILFLFWSAVFLYGMAYQFSPANFCLTHPKVPACSSVLKYSTSLNALSLNTLQKVSPGGKAP